LLLSLTLLIASGFLATPTAAAAADPPNSLGLTTTYDVSANISWGANAISVTSTATVTNTTEAPVEALTFTFIPARIGQMSLREVRVGEEGANAQVDDANLIVQLPVALDPGAQTTVTIGYDALFNTSARKKKWPFLKKYDVVTAYRWIPWLSKRHTWSTPNFGETYVTEAASEVRVTLSSDRADVKYATSGSHTGDDGTTFTFVAHNVRDFNFSASPRYRVTAEDHNGVRLAFYTLSLSPSSLAKSARFAFDTFSNEVGAYPYETLSVAEIPVGGGMESPAMLWIPSNATSSTRRRYLVTHEIAHQWFYGVVGNDQASDPFADEATAEFLTRSVVGFRDSKCAQSNLDGSVYDYGSACYYEIIYVQGADYLNDYRQQIGNDAFWAGIRAYYDRYRFGLGGTLELLDTLDEQAPEGTAGSHQDRFPTLFPSGG
jgi:hypothetical protein